MECPYCKKTCKNTNSLKQHAIRCKQNPNQIKVWNTGQTKYNNDLVKKLANDKKGKKRPEHSLRLKGKSFNKSGKAKTNEAEKLRVEKIRQHAKQRNFGGYVRGSGRGKKGWYRGIFCDSSWELAFLLYSLDNNDNIKRNTEIRKYVYEGKIRNYIPDFIIDDRIIEIKGYSTAQWKAKISQNPDIEVYEKEDMDPILEYVIEKYGKDYIRLYEGR